MFKFIGSIIGYIVGIAFSLVVLFVVGSMAFTFIKMVIVGCINSIKGIGKMSANKTSKNETSSVCDLADCKYDPAEIDYVSPTSSYDSTPFDFRRSESDDIRKMKAEISKAVRDGIAMSDLEHGRSVGNYGSSDDLFIK